MRNHGKHGKQEKAPALSVLFPCFPWSILLSLRWRAGSGDEPRFAWFVWFVDDL